MQDDDFKIWNASPRRFFRLHQGLILRIIEKHYFAGHRNLRQKKYWNEQIETAMASAVVVQKIKAYTHKSTFLVFYISILKELVEQESQREDVDLLQADFDRLILKYRPLAQMIVGWMIAIRPKLKSAQQDLGQQLLINLLGKKNIITSTYNNKYLFRSFVWTIIKNESRNLIRAELRQLPQFESLEIAFIEALSKDGDSDQMLLIEDALKILDGKIRICFTIRIKLIICLKVIFNIPLNNGDFHGAIAEDAFDHFMQEKIIPAGDDLDRDKQVTQRFEMIAKVLNLLDNSATNADSYHRWTNLQIAGLIKYLNDNHLMSFDRETFRLLIEKYFCNFYWDGFPKQEQKIVYSNKEK